MNYTFTRQLRLRECGALHIPVAIEADIYIFDLLDCVCEIKYDKELFETFDQVRVLHEGVISNAYCIPITKVKQTEYRGYVMVW